MRNQPESSFICNNYACICCCLSWVPANITTQLSYCTGRQVKGKVINESAEGTVMREFSDFVLVTIANIALARRDSCLDHLKSGIKYDRLADIRNAPLQLTSLFPDSTICKTENNIVQYDDRHNSGESQKKQRCYQPYAQSSKSGQDTRWKSGPQTWKIMRQKQKGLGQGFQLFIQTRQRWQSGNTLASHLCGRGSIPVMAVSGKAGSCLPLVGSLQYTTLANSMYWFPLPFQLPVVI